MPDPTSPLADPARRALLTAGTLSAAALAAGPAGALSLDAAGRHLDLPEGAVVVVAHLTALAGREAEVREATARLVTAVRETEEGCLLFMAHGGADVPGRILFWEVFADEAGFTTHKESQHLADWLAAIEGATATAITVHVLSPIAAA